MVPRDCLYLAGPAVDGVPEEGHATRQEINIEMSHELSRCALGASLGSVAEEINGGLHGRLRIGEAIGLKPTAAT